MRYRVSRYFGEDFVFEDGLTAMAFAETMFKHQIRYKDCDEEIRIIIEDEPQEAAESED